MQNSWIFLNVLISFLVHPKAQISLTIPILLGVPNMQIFLTLSLPAHTLLGVLNLQKFPTVSLPTHTLLGVLNLLSLSLPTLLEVLNNQFRVSSTYTFYCTKQSHCRRTKLIFQRDSYIAQIWKLTLYTTNQVGVLHVLGEAEGV